MTEKLKLLSVLAAVFLIVGLTYVLVYSLLGLSNREKSVIKINNQEIKVEIVDSPLAQAKGLADRNSIGENEGMLFIFPRPAIQRFWMKGMKFPIDIIWIKNNQVVGFEENVLPEMAARETDLKIYSSPEPVDKVLEMKANSVKRLQIKVGDLIEF
jgi:hypothetical protein